MDPLVIAFILIGVAVVGLIVWRWRGKRRQSSARVGVAERPRSRSAPQAPPDEDSDDDDDGGGIGGKRIKSVQRPRRADNTAPTGRQPATTQQRQQQAPAASKGRLKQANVEAALRERQAMREQEEYETAIAMSRSMSGDRGRPKTLPPVNKPHDPKAAAAAAAAARATSGSGSRQPVQQRAPRTQLAPLAPISPGSPAARSSRTLPPLNSGGGALRETRQHSAAFKQAVEETFNDWCTNQYASNAFLHEIGRTAREEQRALIAEQLEHEWRAAGRPVYEYAVERKFEAAGSGQRLGGGGGGRGGGAPPPRLPPRTYDMD